MNFLGADFISSATRGTLNSIEGSHIKMETRVRSPKIIDLFAGVGGLSLGAARAGFDVVLAIEKDKHAYAAHKVNFPNAKHSDFDISKIDGRHLLELANLEKGELDGLIGGPPCQGFSSMGHRNIDDTRNTLFSKFFELVEESQPKFFIAENVLGILDDQYRSIREHALAQVGSDYIVLPPMRLKASDFGAPTVRERVFFVGYKPQFVEALSAADFFNKKSNKPVYVKDALLGLPTIRSNWILDSQGFRKVQQLPRSPYYDRIVGKIPAGVGCAQAITLYKSSRITTGCLGTLHSPEVKKRYDLLKNGQQDVVSKSIRLNRNGFCPTLRAGTGPDKGSYQAVRPIHPNSPRVITPREAARLQGFPDWFQFGPSKWHSFRQIGNSVCPLVAEIVCSVIYSKLNSHEST